MTRESFEAALRQMGGHRVAAVRYFGLECWDAAGNPIEPEWDLEKLHEATMAVELTLDDGSQYCASWGDAFGHFGLELHAKRADDVLTVEFPSQDFTDHP